MIDATGDTRVHDFGRRSSAAVLPIALGIAGVLALTIAAQTYWSMLSHGHSFARMLAWQLASWLFWGAAAPFVIATGGTLLQAPEGRHRHWTRIFAIGALLIAGHTVLAAASIVWFQPFLPVQTHSFPDALVDHSLLLVVDVLVYAVLLLIGSALWAYDRARHVELRESQLEAELTRANLEALRLEIQPHFLFNTLHTIAALIRRQSTSEALAMLVGLSGLMRETLERRHNHVATLESEIAFIRKYVDLYRGRFSDRLDVTYAIEAEALTHRIPTFVLQPLVENAFRHGIGSDMRACHVEIGARLESNQLNVWVADDGVGVTEQATTSRGAGTGLTNVRSRVNGIFGPSARVEIGPREDGGTIARIVLPVMPAAALSSPAS